MRAFVISLARRADRLASFNEHIATTGLDGVFSYAPVEAADGLALDLDALRPRIAKPEAHSTSKRKVEDLPEREVRGILGCALSHVDVWRRVAELPEPAAVFEDDARLGPGVDAKMVAAALKKLPGNADLCWLNDCHYEARGGLRFRVRRKLSRYLGELPRPTRASFTKMPDIMVATDAYIITPSFARRLRDELVNSLGAIDRYMQLYVARTKSHAYQSYPPLFSTDFTDSDTSPRKKSTSEANRLEEPTHVRD